MVATSAPIEDILDVSQVVFSVIVLALSAGIAAHVVTGPGSGSSSGGAQQGGGGGGYGSRRWREVFIALICGLLVSVQLYYLVVAAQHAPVFPYVYDVTIRRTACLESAHGGKRPDDSTFSAEFVNPCFCRGAGAACFIVATDAPVPANTSCPTDGSAYCLSNSTGQQIPLLVPSDRGCGGGSSGKCSQEDPCDPCDRDGLVLWKGGRCRSCVGGKQACNFVTGVGPYCRVAPGSKAVQPCRWCCTEPEPLLVNGTCY